MNNYIVDKLAQHSKENRIKGMIAIRGANQQGNIYQQDFSRHTRFPQKNERRAMNEELPMIGDIDLVPVNRVGKGEDFISG